MTELALVRTGLDFSLEGFLLSREAMRCTPKTLEHYRYTLGSFTEYLARQGIHDVADITPHDIRAYLVGLQHRGLKDTTQHIHARGIRAWLNWLVDEGELDISPMKRVAMHRLEKRIPPPFSPREVQTLLAACDQRTVLGARNYAIILTLLDTGLRARADKQVYELRIGGAGHPGDMSGKASNASRPSAWRATALRSHASLCTAQRQSAKQPIGGSLPHNPLSLSMGHIVQEAYDECTGSTTPVLLRLLDPWRHYRLLGGGPTNGGRLRVCPAHLHGRVLGRLPALPLSSPGGSVGRCPQARSSSP